MQRCQIIFTVCIDIRARANERSNSFYVSPRCGNMERRITEVADKIYIVQIKSNKFWQVSHAIKQSTQSDVVHLRAVLRAQSGDLVFEVGDGLI